MIIIVGAAAIKLFLIHKPDANICFIVLIERLFPDYIAVNRELYSLIGSRLDKKKALITVICRNKKTINKGREKQQALIMHCEIAG